MSRTHVKFTANPFDAALQLQALYRVEPGEDALIEEVAHAYVQQFGHPLRSAQVDLEYYEEALKRCLKEKLVLH